MSNTNDENTAFYFDEMAKPLLASAKVYTNNVKENAKIACKELGKYLQNLNTDTINLEDLLDCNDQFSYLISTIERMEQTCSELINALVKNMTEQEYSKFINFYNILVSDYALACAAYGKFRNKIVK